MRYFGGKARLSNVISGFLNQYKDKYNLYVEPFCGACNVATKVEIPNKILNDKHHYLIAMWKALQNGWEPPKEITKEDYYYLKNNKDEKPYLTGFAGFACSFAGKWYGGYASSREGRNYALNGYNSVTKKIKQLGNVEFLNKDFLELDFIDSLIYCDLPYKDATQPWKEEVGEFNHELFINWVKKQSKKNLVFVSEYRRNVPNDAEIVFEIKSRTDIRDKNGNFIPTQEVLFTYNNI